MKNQIKQYNPYIIVAIGLIGLVASTDGVNSSTSIHQQVSC